MKFETSGPLDFTNVIYVIAVDMCGTGTPYPNGLNTGFANYTYSFVVGGGFGSTALPLLFEYYLSPSSNGFLKLPVNNLNPSNTEFQVPYQGQSNEFEFIFRRSDLNEPIPVMYPCPGVTAEPTVSPTASAIALTSPSPTAIPSVGASSTPAASATPTPNSSGPNDTTGVDSPPYLTTWTFNLMTFSPQGGPSSLTPLDSLGIGGPTDNTFSGIVVDTTATNTYTFFRPQPESIPQNTSAYITYGEIDTYL